MATDNVKLLERFYDAFRHRDMRTALDLVSPKIEVWQSDAVPWGGTYRGIAEFRDYASGLSQHVDANVKAERFLDAGDQAVMVGRSQGRAWKSEARFDVPVVHLWTIGDGRLTRLEVHMDTARMLEALGT